MLTDVHFQAVKMQRVIHPYQLLICYWSLHTIRGKSLILFGRKKRFTFPLKVAVWQSGLRFDSVYILHTKALYRKALVYFMNHVALWNIEEEESNCTHRSNFHKPRSSESAWKQWEEERVRVITGQTAQEQRSWF